nr:hypothetical protein [Tistrella mobilis]
MRQAAPPVAIGAECGAVGRQPGRFRRRPLAGQSPTGHFKPDLCCIGSRAVIQTKASGFCCRHHVEAGEEQRIDMAAPAITVDRSGGHWRRQGIEPGHLCKQAMFSRGHFRLGRPGTAQAGKIAHTSDQTVETVEEIRMARGRREEAGHQSHHHHTDQRAFHPRHGECDRLIRRKERWQHHHGRGHAGHQWRIGRRAADQPRGTGAGGHPEPENDQRQQGIPRKRDRRQPKARPDQGAEDAKDAALDQQAARGLGDHPDRHRRPIGVLNMQQGGDREGDQGGGGKAHRLEEPGPIEPEPRRPAVNGERHHDEPR